MDAIRDSIKRFISGELLRLLPDTLGDSTSLVESGIVDSTGVLEVVAFLEESFAIKNRRRGARPREPGQHRRHGRLDREEEERGRVSAVPFPSTRWKLRSCSEVGAKVGVLGRVRIYGGGDVCIGNRVLFDGRRAPVELHAFPGARILIEDDVEIGSGVSLEAREWIRIGAGARLRRLLQDHGQPLSCSRRRPGGHA